MACSPRCHLKPPRRAGKSRQQKLSRCAGKILRSVSRQPPGERCSWRLTGLDAERGELGPTKGEAGVRYSCGAAGRRVAQGLAVPAIGTVNSCGGLVDAGARTDKCGGNERRVSSGAAGVRRESLGLTKSGCARPSTRDFDPSLCAKAAHHMMPQTIR
jgi:hypothetical protein